MKQALIKATLEVGETLIFVAGLILGYDWAEGLTFLLVSLDIALLAFYVPVTFMAEVLGVLSQKIESPISTAPEKYLFWPLRICRIGILAATSHLVFAFFLGFMQILSFALELTISESQKEKEAESSDPHVMPEEKSIVSDRKGRPPETPVPPPSAYTYY